jgi:hypothetical protein
MADEITAKPRKITRQSFYDTEIFRKNSDDAIAFYEPPPRMKESEPQW